MPTSVADPSSRHATASLSRVRKTNESLWQRLRLPDVGVCQPLRTAYLLTGDRQMADDLVQAVAYDVTTGQHDAIVHVGEEGVPRYYLTSRVAAGILAAGEVREAQPPHQPWNDVRSLRPTVRDWVSEHKALVVLAVMLLVGGVVVGARQLSRRRLAAHSRSSA